MGFWSSNCSYFLFISNQLSLKIYVICNRVPNSIAFFKRITYLWLIYYGTIWNCKGTDVLHRFQFSHEISLEQNMTWTCFNQLFFVENWGFSFLFFFFFTVSWCSLVNSPIFLVRCFKSVYQRKACRQFILKWWME